MPTENTIINHADEMQKRIIALAGLCQATHAVNQVAVNNYFNEQEAEVNLQSLFVTSPESTLDTFGGNLANIHTGLGVLIVQLGGQTAKHIPSMEVNKYNAACLVLAKKALSNPDIMQTLSRGLEQVRIHVNNLGILHDTTIGDIATLYQNTISNIPPKVIVSGRDNHLRDAKNANKIRTLLLCAVRAAILWRQVGGSRFHFLLQRKNYLQTAESLYAS